MSSARTSRGFKPSRRQQKWDYCDRCGFRRLEGDLVKQDGYNVCVQTCYDDSSPLPPPGKRAEPTVAYKVGSRVVVPRAVGILRVVSVPTSSHTWALWCYRENGTTSRLGVYAVWPDEVTGAATTIAAAAAIAAYINTGGWINAYIEATSSGADVTWSVIEDAYDDTETAYWDFDSSPSVVGLRAY